MKDITKKYDNGEIIIVWQPVVCIHSANCVKGLPSVFNVNASPWIDVSGADTETIVSLVSKCPSGALSILKKK